MTIPLDHRICHVGVQRYTTYREYRETAVQDTYHDTKKIIKERIVTIYYTLLYFNIR